MHVFEIYNKRSENILAKEFIMNPEKFDKDSSNVISQLPFSSLNEINVYSQHVNVYYSFLCFNFNKLLLIK